MGFGHPGLGQAQSCGMLVGIGLMGFGKESAGLLPQRARLRKVLGRDGLGLRNQGVAGFEKWGVVVSSHCAEKVGRNF